MTLNTPLTVQAFALLVLGLSQGAYAAVARVMRGVRAVLS